VTPIMRMATCGSRHPASASLETQRSVGWEIVQENTLHRFVNWLLEMRGQLCCVVGELTAVGAGILFGRMIVCSELQTGHALWAHTNRVRFSEGHASGPTT